VLTALTDSETVLVFAALMGTAMALTVTVAATVMGLV
jgi:hypothetical protein